jgi:hypothetical protein
VIVNEIMYAPLPEHPEYVELYNAANTSLDLNGWVLSDRPGSDGTANEVLMTGSQHIEQGGYFVIASDSSAMVSFPHLANFDSTMILFAANELSLNNDGDDLVLRDPSGAAVDSLSYLPSWHLPGIADYTGRSLERIHPSLTSTDGRNWSTCVLPVGGTPGLANSVLTESIASSSQISFSPNPFSPDGDGHQDQTLISYRTNSGVSLISVRIYDIRGRLIRTLATREPSAESVELVWNGYDDENRKARIGMYVVFLEVLNDGGAVLEGARGVVVLGAKL